VVHRRALLTGVLLFVVWAAIAQEVPVITDFTVTGLPERGRVTSYSLARLEDRELLAIEMTAEDGISALYLLEPVRDEFRARLIGPSLLPGVFVTVEPMRRVTREIAGGPAGRRYWTVGGGEDPFGSSRLLSAPVLEELSTAGMSGERWPETPDLSSGLGIYHVVLAPGGSLTQVCLLEPNMVEPSERITTAGAWAVNVLGEEMLLVTMIAPVEQPDAELFLRIYSGDLELVYQSPPIVQVDTNRLADLLAADVTGDGTDEYIVFGTSPDSRPVVILGVERKGEGPRTISLNSCGTRMNGDDVGLLQQELERRGFSVGEHGIDGWFGPDTRAAVIRFQRSSGLPVTGVVTVVEWETLGL
jgi:hypothetical protein